MPFFVEWDSGDEVLAILEDKVASYDTVAVFTRWRWPVLFVLPSMHRATNLHMELNGWRAAGPTPVATIARDHLAANGHSPAEAVWRLHGHDGPRLRLAALPYTDDDPDPFDATRPHTTTRNRSSATRPSPTKVRL